MGEQRDKAQFYLAKGPLQGVASIYSMGIIAFPKSEITIMITDFLQQADKQSFRVHSMPRLPWRQFAVPEPERSYTALLSSLPLKSFRKLPQFFLYVVQIQRQLKRSPGLIAYTLQARIFRKVFFRLSVWKIEFPLGCPLSLRERTG